MSTLYPKAYVEPVPEAKPAQSSAVAVARIKALADKVPRRYEELVKVVQAEERAAGRQWTNDELHAMILAVDAEWHPAPKEVEK
jgi:hypothetical protein